LSQTLHQKQLVLSSAQNGRSGFPQKTQKDKKNCSGNEKIKEILKIFAAFMWKRIFYLFTVSTRQSLLFLNKNQ